MINLERRTAEMRGKLVELSHQARTPHLGSSLSCAEILTVLYSKILDINPKDSKNPNRDQFILSKGHAATTLYVALAQHGFFPESELNQYATLDSPLPEHPSPECINGVEWATGSLGHGLSVGLGMAIAKRTQKLEGSIYVLLSDGECNEGSIWEAALFAPAQKLDNLCLIVDFNKWQATGRSQEVTALEPLEEKFASFGWDSYRVNGHNIVAITEALQLPPRQSGRPKAIICDTVKGKGISFMEDDNNWHYRIPTEEEILAARKELGLS